MAILTATIWIVQVGLVQETDPIFSWIAILAATLLLKWLHTIIREADGK